ncbi:uncharacterized protein LOC118419754 [Branchiostoma floridae]|uniref:Uncharacterized protein LOC118419754 n=1 Tax=Branchiostoma floridae TaxID=7739 RepID=A0A9J7MW73_BRAFL|nr:uncharacterized protein LOC118419754 [Branchiostoma floridae]
MLKTPTIVRFKVSNDTLAQGETLYLVCEASGKPAPNIIVTLPSGLIASAESGVRVTVGVNGTITVTNVTAADAGLYICIATNTVGSASRTVFIGAASVSPPFSASPLVPASSPSGNSEGKSTIFPLEFAVGFGTAGAVLLVFGLGLKLRLKGPRGKKKAPIALNNDSLVTDDMVNNSTYRTRGQGRSLNPEITNSAASANEQAGMPENAYEDPESLLAIAGSLRSDVVSKEESVSAQKPMKVHELVNIVYGKDGSGSEDIKPVSMPKKEAEAATSHASYENTHVQETVHDASHVTNENVDEDEAVLYASAQVIYGHEDDKAQSAASQPIYKTDRDKTESPVSIHGNDVQKAESSSPHAIYNNESEKPESPASQIIYGNDNQKAESFASDSIYKNDDEKPESRASRDIYEAGDEKTATTGSTASCLIYENNDED